MAQDDFFKWDRQPVANRSAFDLAAAHPIYYAELLYSVNPCNEVLDKYKEIVFETALFMESYAEYDEEINDMF